MWHPRSYTWHSAEIERQKATTQLSEDGRLLELSYENLCANPAETLETITTFLNVSPDLLNSEQVRTVKNMNYKYQQ